MTPLALLLAAAAILPSDRMAMADRMFDRGEYAAARAEYLALREVKGLAKDEILFRLAETARVTGDKATARRTYQELLKGFPRSRYADRARLKGALAGTPEQQRLELPPLDADEVAAPLRAEALYHLAELTGDARLFGRCVKLDPKGPFSVAARFRWAALLEKSPELSDRREALGIFQELSKHSDKTLARKALYMAICSCYTEKWSALQKLVNRYFREYPGGEEETKVRVMSAWSLYQAEKYTDAELVCANVPFDDLAYLRAACALARRDSARARTLFKAYLDDYPQGRYRETAELQQARLNYLAVKDGDDKMMIVEAARQSAKLSKAPNDRLRYAWAMENAGLSTEAVVEYAAIAKDFPKTATGAEALFRKAVIDIRASRWSAAEQTLAEALAGGLPTERQAEALYWRGIAACRLEHETEGVGYLKAALAQGLKKDAEREAKLIVADYEFKSGRETEAKNAYADLVLSDNESCTRMTASRLRNVGRFLLGSRGGTVRADAAEVCARALVRQGGTPEWRQAGYALQGAAQEAAGLYSVAIESYRLAMKEPARPMTEDLPPAVLALGVLEAKAGEHAAADATLCEAVRLFAQDPARRVQAYLWLARNSKQAGATDDARRYATIVMTLFDDAAASAEAEALVKSLPEVKK